MVAKKCHALPLEFRRCITFASTFFFLNLLFTLVQIMLGKTADKNMVIEAFGVSFTKNESS